jgi:3',5'-cyclic AMP phosphodiesterase CpdA
LCCSAWSRTARPRPAEGCSSPPDGAPRRPGLSCLLGWAPLLVALLLLPSAWGQAPTSTQCRFVVFGDNRGEADGRQPAVFSALVKRMAALDPDFVLGTGDYIYGAGSDEGLRAQWNEFFWALQPLQSRKRVYFVPAPGNHEIQGGGGNRLFLEYFKRLYFSFDWGGSHFIILDTEVPGEESRIAGKQRAWLSQDLAQARGASHIFVTLHRPLYPVSIHKGDSLDKYPAERDALHALFVQYRVACVFAGHEHLYSRTERDGVQYTITGGGGADLYASQAKGGLHHFLYVTADPMRYKIEVVRQ